MNKTLAERIDDAIVVLRRHESGGSTYADPDTRALLMECREAVACFRLVAVGAPCRLADCPPGPFSAVRNGGGLGFKTEYGRMEVVPGTNTGRGQDLRWTVGSKPDVYCLESGETWCADDLVRPLEVARD